MKLEFSSDQYFKLSNQDRDTLNKINEQEFDTAHDSEQAQIKKDRGDWLLSHLPEFVNIIKYGGEIIGSTLLLPCTSQLMGDFICKNINEEELFQEIEQKFNWKNFESIYFCSAVIVPKFRRKGIATLALEKSIQRIFLKKKVKLAFYWGYSYEGSILAKNIAKKFNLNLKVRKK